MTDLLDSPPVPLTCVHCGAEAQSAAGLASHVRNRHADIIDVPPDTEEEQGPKPGLLARLGFKRDPKPQTTAGRPKPAPKRRGRRVSGADILALPFEHGGRMLAASRPCTANILQWESAWGAYVLDEALAGTLPDRLIVQPLARNYQRVAMVESVVGPVALAFAMESRPQLIPALMPEMRRAIRGAAPFMLKAIAKKKAEDAEIEEAFHQAYPTAPEGATADEMIDSLLTEVFAPLMAAARAAQTEREPADVPA